MKKFFLLISLAGVLAIISYLIYSYYFAKKVEAPTDNFQKEQKMETGFMGPTGQPYIEGPTTQPPGY